jgi:hypothetical protein
LVSSLAGWFCRRLSGSPYWAIAPRCFLTTTRRCSRCLWPLSGSSSSPSSTPASEQKEYRAGFDAQFRAQNWNRRVWPGVVLIEVGRFDWNGHFSFVMLPSFGLRRRRSMDATLSLLNLAGAIALLLWGVHVVQSGVHAPSGRIYGVSSPGRSVVAPRRGHIEDPPP